MFSKCSFLFQTSGANVIYISLRCLSGESGIAKLRILLLDSSWDCVHFCNPPNARTLDVRSIVSAVCIHPRQCTSETIFSLSLFSLLSPCRRKKRTTLTHRVATSYTLLPTPLKWKFRGAEALGEGCVYYQGMRN